MITNPINHRADLTDVIANTPHVPCECLSFSQGCRMFRIEYSILFIQCDDVVVSIIMLIVVNCGNHAIVWDGHRRENRIVCIISISGEW